MAFRLTRLVVKSVSFVGTATDDVVADAIKLNEDVDGAANCKRDWRSIVFDEIPNDVLSIIFANGLFLM